VRVCGLGLVVVAMLVGVGCGGSNDATSETTSAPKEKPSSLQTPAERAGSLAVQLGRLEDAGYTVAVETPTEAGQTGGLEVGGVTILGYADTNQAKTIGGTIEQIAENHAGQGVVEIRGPRIYQLLREDQLTPKQKETFAKVLQVAEAE